VTRRIHRERLVLLGWGRAIAMQFAHPLIAAAVMEHSAFRAGRLARLRRLHGTVRAMLSLTFGNDATILGAATRIRAMHDRVNGTLVTGTGSFAAGTPYSAQDPALLEWVLITLLDSLPLAHATFVEPLSSDEHDAYCRESSSVGRLLGVPEAALPQNMSDVRTAVARQLSSGTLRVGDTARMLMRHILYPPLHVAYWPAARMNRLATIGLLPPQLRAEYGFAWHPGDDRALRRWAWSIQHIHGVTTDRLRYWKDARPPYVSS
jgi:uncharacterized protein (DUF2236 family)